MRLSICCTKDLFRNHRTIALFTGVLLSVLVATANDTTKEQEWSDSLPKVFPKGHADLLENRLREEAVRRYPLYHLPGNKNEWEKYRTNLRQQIIQKTGALLNQKLPLDYKETGSIKMQGYTIKNIMYQSRPGVYVTANLFVPDGRGPFPAVINMHGHGSRFSGTLRGHILASHGYVCLCVDAWGSGERAVSNDVKEYHGGTLGASLMDVGESLMGMQITDNSRGVDLLASLSYVDASKIGATGSSGGGNQTMWLAALDERVKAAVPVVSVGTFESYVMRHNCICELLIYGLNFTEEAGVLALVAPRALKIANGSKDNTLSFYPAEMKRSFNNAKPVFALYGADKKLTNQVFDGPHSYPVETREAMLGLFDFYLKGIGDGSPVKEKSITPVPDEQLFVLKRQKDARVVNTADFCIGKGKELRTAYLNTVTIETEKKRNELKKILRIAQPPAVKKVTKYPGSGDWERFALETTDDKLIPVVCKKPAGAKELVLIITPDGKDAIPSSLVNECMGKGKGIIAFDLSGSGELTSTVALPNDRNRGKFHAQARAELWLGKTMMGEWAEEINSVISFVKSQYKDTKVSVYGIREAGLAALFYTAINGKTDSITLKNIPVSYLFDRPSDYFSIATHLPGFLHWGDVSLVAALSNTNITLIDPLTIGGQQLNAEQAVTYQKEFAELKRKCASKGLLRFQ